MLWYVPVAKTNSAMLMGSGVSQVLIFLIITHLISANSASFPQTKQEQAGTWR
jgi:hypothetical protein